MSTATAVADGATASSVIPLVMEVTLQQKRKQQQLIRRWTATIVGFCLAAMGTSILAIYSVQSYWVYMACVWPLLLAPYTIYQRKRINRLPSLVQEINLCRQLVNRMMIQNRRLQKETTRLTHQVQRLRGVDQKLYTLAHQQGVGEDEIRRLVRENGQTLRAMERLQRAQELQSLFQIMLSADRNNSGTLTEMELDELSQRLQVFSAKRFLPVDDSIVRQAFHLSGLCAVPTTALFKYTKEIIAENHRLEDDDDDEDDDDLWWNESPSAREFRYQRHLE